MSKIDRTRPVSSIKHDDKRAAIPDSAHQGEEQMAISGQPEQSEYQVFRHEFQRGRDHTELRKIEMPTRRCS